MNNINEKIPIGKATALLIGVFVSIGLLISGLFFFMYGSVFNAKNEEYVDTTTNEKQDDDKLTGDIVKRMDGTWETQTANNNDETTIISFSNHHFTMISEMTVAADVAYIYEKLDDEDAFYDDYYGAPITVETTPEGMAIVRVTAIGTFTSTENEIIFTYEDGSTIIQPFSHIDDTITIDEELFVRRK